SLPIIFTALSSLYGSIRCLPSFPTRRSSDLANRTYGLMEVRWSDFGWGPYNDQNLAGRFTTQTFTLPRLSKVQDYFLRQFDGSIDRKRTRLNSSHQIISYAVFCLKKKTTEIN